jgi:hypothetical protein
MTSGFIGLRPIRSALRRILNRVPYGALKIIARSKTTDGADRDRLATTSARGQPLTCIKTSDTALRGSSCFITGGIRSSVRPHPAVCVEFCHGVGTIDHDPNRFYSISIIRLWMPVRLWIARASQQRQAIWATFPLFEETLRFSAIKLANSIFSRDFSDQPLEPNSKLPQLSSRQRQ